MPDPQADDWIGLSWSHWHDLDQAVRDHLIPVTAGLYRFRARGEPGLLYIGEGANRRRRLRTLARYRNAQSASYYLCWPAGARRPFRGHYAAPFIRLCEDAGCVMEVSWAADVHANRIARRKVEACLIREHLARVGREPPCQRGGRGVAAYLEARAFLVAPEERREQVVRQVNRPTFERMKPPLVDVCRYISFEGVPRGPDSSAQLRFIPEARLAPSRERIMRAGRPLAASPARYEHQPVQLANPRVGDERPSSRRSERSQRTRPLQANQARSV